VGKCEIWNILTECTFNELQSYLFTYLLHGAEFCLRSQPILNYSRNLPHFMKPDGSLPHSQVPATCPYPEPYQSSPCPPSYFLKIYLNIILPFTPVSSKCLLSLRFPHQNSMYASPLPHKLLDLITRSTDHQASGLQLCIYLLKCGNADFLRLCFSNTQEQKKYSSSMLIFFCRDSPQWAFSFTRFLYHTQRRTTAGRTPLDE